MNSMNERRVLVEQMATKMNKKHMNITSRYYLSDMPAALTEHIGGLKAGTEYTIKIVANSFWRTRSDALTARFATL